MTTSGFAEAGTDQPSVVEGYRRRWAHHDAERDRAARVSRRLSTVRGFTFVAAVGVLVAVDFLEGGAENLAFGMLAAVVAAFVALVVVHRRVRREERWSEALASVAMEGILRGERRWIDLEDALFHKFLQRL